MKDRSYQDIALEGQNLSATYGEKTALHHVDLKVMKGAITALVGRNGSGKSTLLKVCSRLLERSGGSIIIEGADLFSYSSREIAKKLAILPQGPSAPPYLSVKELVEQGRYPQVGALRMLKYQDHEAVDKAIERVGLTALKDRDVDTLSGGERQRAWLALALAQETSILALDEPTTFLDIGHQYEVLELIKRLNLEHQITVLMVVHDLNHAASFSDHMVVLEEGKVVASGEPWNIMTPDLLLKVFGVNASVIKDTVTNRPLIVTHGSSSYEDLEKKEAVLR
ncbi:ABC transporter ATP-binding protein [Salipaludibacillus sp. HK11]|uniref:ABC transporter ATP-binding protein n=1 Tax=Salipaludibacillus sp. HK11 TaxID=3394320 RepID=UPI0039FD5350